MRKLALIALAALGGCVEADLDANGYYICTEDGHCAPNKVCRFNRCYDDPPPACSPYDSAGCASNQRCASPEAGPVCVTAGPQGRDQSCEGDLECGFGLTPVNYGDVGCICSKLCRDDIECGPGSLCTSTLVVRDSHQVWGPVPIGLCD